MSDPAGRSGIDLAVIASHYSGWMDGWMGGWMDGWMDGWMAGWMDGWMMFLSDS